MPRFKLDPFAPLGIVPVAEQPAVQRETRRQPMPTTPVRLVTNDPSGGLIGELIYNTIDSELKIWTGTSWVAIGGTTTVGGTFDYMDGTPLQFVDGTYLDFIG